LTLNMRSLIATGTLLLLAIPCFAAQPIKRSFDNYTLGDQLGKVPPSWEHEPPDHHDYVENEKGFFVPSTSPGVEFILLRYIDDKLYWISFKLTGKYVSRAGGFEAFVNKSTTKYGKPLINIGTILAWYDGRTTFSIRWHENTVKGKYTDEVLYIKRNKRATVPVPDF